MKQLDNDSLILSDKLGAAVVLGDGVLDYATATLHGRSDTLTYEDMQEFQDFTANYFTMDVDGDLILLRKDTGQVLRLTPEDQYTFEPDGTTVADLADKM